MPWPPPSALDLVRNFFCCNGTERHRLSRSSGRRCITAPRGTPHFEEAPTGNGRARGRQSRGSPFPLDGAPAYGRDRRSSRGSGLPSSPFLSPARGNLLRDLFGGERSPLVGDPLPR